MDHLIAEFMPVINNSEGEIVPEEVLPQLTVRPASSGDTKAICALFKKIFHEEMTIAHWQWKYGRQQSRAIVVYQGDQLLAHYGGVGTDILLEGEESSAIQVTDLMVDPVARHAVRSKSPFYISAKKFLQSFVGYNNPFLLGYGFPSERAMGLSEKLGFFVSVGTMWETEWQLPAGKKASNEKVVLLDVSNYADYEATINKLWLKFSKHFRKHIICRKDAAYFKWRYLDHPDKKYSLYLVSGRLLHQPKALLVMKHEAKKSLLMDLLDSTLSFQKLIDLAANLAQEKGNNKMITWCSDAFSDTFNINSAVQKPLPIIIPANTGSDGPAPELQKHKWWLMPGDTDYL